MEEYRDEVERQLIAKTGALIDEGSFTMGLPLFGPASQNQSFKPKNYIAGGSLAGPAGLKRNGGGPPNKGQYFNPVKYPLNTHTNAKNPNLLPNTSSIVFDPSKFISTGSVGPLGGNKFANLFGPINIPVSYTHLTLPTILLV